MSFALSRILMNAADPSGGTPGGGTPPPPSDGGNGAPPAAGNEPANPSHKDWNAAAANMRKTQEAVSAIPGLVAAEVGKAMEATFAKLGLGVQPPSPAPAGGGAPAPVAGGGVDFQRELALRDAMDEHDVPKDKRPTVRRLFAAEKPGDVGGWVKQTMSDPYFKSAPGGASGPPSPGAPPVPPAPGVDPGPPAGVAPSVEPFNILKAPPHVIDKMTPEDVVASLQARPGKRQSARALYASIELPHERKKQ